MKIAIFLATGFEEGEALFLADILKRASFDVKLVSITSSDLISGSHDITVKTDMFLDDSIKDFDMIILPGGLPGATNLRDSNKVIEMVKYFNENNKYIGAICAAPIVLDRAGIVKNKKLTSYPSDEYKNLLKNSGANYVEDIVVVDNNLITSRGPATVMEFAYKIIDTLGGNSNLLKESMLYNLLNK